MLRRKSNRLGRVDGGEGRGVRLSGRDERPATGYRSTDDDDVEIIDRDFEWDDSEEAERRRDPLRR